MGKKPIGRWLAVTAAALIAAGAPVFDTAAAGEKLAYRLKWLFNASVVGDLYADAQGYFQSAGLDVDVKAGGPERDAIRELELGLAQFGVASADQVVRAMSKGAPVVVIAQIFQVNPLQWIHRSTIPPIERLDQLRGRRIGVTFGGNDEAILRALLAKAGLTEADVSLFSVRYDYTPFYQGRVDIWPVYRNTQAVFLSRQLGAEGEAVAFFNPMDFGVRFVANSIVTSRKMAESDPETVRTFLRSLLAGWSDALAPENAEAAAALLARFETETPGDLLKEQLAITRSLVVPADGRPLGAIDRDAWAQTERIMVEQGLIEGPVRVETVLMPDFAPGR